MRTDQNPAGTDHEPSRTHQYGLKTFKEPNSCTLVKSNIIYTLFTNGCRKNSPDYQVFDRLDFSSFSYLFCMYIAVAIPPL